MRIELVTSRGDLPALAKRWDELALSDPRDGFFRTSRWYRAWLEHVRPDAEPFVILVRGAGDEILGLAPLCRLKYRDLGFHLKSVCWGGREVVSGDFLDILAETEERSRVTSTVLEFLQGARSQWSLLVMGELLEGSESYRAVETFGRKRGLRLRRQEERICPYIALPATFEAYLNGLGSSSRYNIRRRTREVIEKKGAAIQVYSEPSGIREHLDTLLSLHQARWRKERLPGTLGRPGFLPFLRDICTNPPAGSSCRLYVLQHENRAVAAVLMFYFGLSAVYYQAGWDPDSALAAHSPAAVLMARTIRDAIDKGMQYYEFGRGDEAYKGRWTKTHRNTVTILLARSFMAKEYLRTASLKDYVKNLVLPNTGRARDEAGSEENSCDPGNAGALNGPRHRALDAPQ